MSFVSIHQFSNMQFLNAKQHEHGGLEFSIPFLKRDEYIPNISICG